jgi:hypothetical protein
MSTDSKQDGRGQILNGSRQQTETARVSLDIGKGLLLIARYLVAHEQFGGDWQRLQGALVFPVSPTNTFRN